MSYEGRKRVQSKRREVRDKVLKIMESGKLRQKKRNTGSHKGERFRKKDHRVVESTESAAPSLKRESRELGR